MVLLQNNRGEGKRAIANCASHPLFQCAELILPWLTPQELAQVSFSCKHLAQLSKSITTRRTRDASRSLEKYPIQFFNPLEGYTSHPYAYFLYIPTQVPSSEAPSRQPWGSLRTPDDATVDTEVKLRENLYGSCGAGCSGSYGSDALVLDELEMGIMSEYGSNCACWMESGNVQAQRAISVRLKIVRDKLKGWGLYADQLILRGRFICEYSGELLTTDEARNRQQNYDELSRAGYFSSALMVVREHLPSGKACLRLNIDATASGNVARFINHSCDGGNLWTVLARSSGSLLPRLCFFASKDVRKGEELTFSYGDSRVRPNGLPCSCGCDCCFGALPSELT